MKALVYLCVALLLALVSVDGVQAFKPAHNKVSANKGDLLSLVLDGNCSRATSCGRQVKNDRNFRAQGGQTVAPRPVAPLYK